MDNENTAQSPATGPGTAPGPTDRANPQPEPPEGQEGASLAGGADERGATALDEAQFEGNIPHAAALLDAIDMIARGLESLVASEQARKVEGEASPRDTGRVHNYVGLASRSLRDLSTEARREFAGASVLLSRDELLRLLSNDAHLRRQRDELQGYAGRLLEERVRPAEQAVARLRDQVAEMQAAQVRAGEIQVKLDVAQDQASRFLDDVRAATHQVAKAQREAQERLEQAQASETRAQALLADLVARTTERDEAQAKCRALEKQAEELVLVRCEALAKIQAQASHAPGELLLKVSPAAESWRQWAIDLVMGSGYRDGSWAVRVDNLPLPAPGRYLLEAPGGERIPVRVWAMPAVVGTSRYVCLSAHPKRVKPEPGWALVVDPDPPAPPPAEDDAPDSEPS